MKERGMPFTDPMVRRVRAGAKTQTRRLVDKLRVRLPAPVSCDSPFVDRRRETVRKGVHRALLNPLGAILAVAGDVQLGIRPGEGHLVCPWADGEMYLGDHGRGRKLWTIKPAPDQRIWVREAWQQGAAAGVLYRADFPDGRHPSGDAWRPSIHMFRRVARVVLAVLVVRLERLQGITEEDAIAEGIECNGPGWLGAPHGTKGAPKVFPTAAQAFGSWWRHLYGQASWDANPWVWAITFTALEGLAA